MYAIRIQPLVSRLKDPGHHKQNWYASCGRHLRSNKTWFLSLTKLGPAFGNLAEPNKSFIIVKSEHLEEAMTLFNEFNVHESPCTLNSLKRVIAFDFRVDALELKTVSGILSRRKFHCGENV